MNKVRRGPLADRLSEILAEGWLGWDTVKKMLYAGDGVTPGGIPIGGLGDTVDYTIYIATAALGGTSSGVGRQLESGTTTATSANKLVNGNASFTSALLNKTVYNTTDGTWAKITAVDSATQLTLSANIMTVGENYVIADAVDTLANAYLLPDSPYKANVTLRLSPGTFAGDATLVGKAAGGNKTFTIQGDNVAGGGGTILSGAITIYDNITLAGGANYKLKFTGKVVVKGASLTAGSYCEFTKRLETRDGAVCTWSNSVTTSPAKLFIYGNSINSLDTCTFTIGNDPTNLTAVNSTVTKGYTLYVATSTLGGSDSTGDGLQMYGGTATTTSAGKLVDSNANFEDDVVGKTVYNSTDDTWAKVTAKDSATQLSISDNIMVSGEAYVISNALATAQKAVDAIPGTVNCDTTVKLTPETYTAGFKLQGKSYSGSFSITVEGTMAAASDSGTSSGANVNYSMGGAGSGATQATLNDTSKAWGVNAYQNKVVIITGGTGSGQWRLIDSNTATQLKIVGYWDTVPDGTSTYKIVDWGTVFNLTADGTAKHAIEVVGVLNVNLKKLRVYDWPSSGSDGAHYGIYVRDYSSVNILDCKVSRNRTDSTASSAIQVESYGVLKTKRLLAREDATNSLVRGLRFNGGSSPELNNTLENTKFDGSAQALVVAAQAFVSAYSNSTGNGVVIRGARTFGVNVNSFSRMDLNASIVTGSTTNNIIVQNGGYMIIRNNCEISSAGGDGIKADGLSIVENAGGSTPQVNSNGGWGVNVINLGFGRTVSTFSYTGNTSGTYTADASSKNT